MTANTKCNFIETEVWFPRSFERETFLSKESTYVEDFVDFIAMRSSAEIAITCRYQSVDKQEILAGIEVPPFDFPLEKIGLPAAVGDGNVL